MPAMMASSKTRLMALFAIIWLVQASTQILFNTSISIDPYQHVRISINSPLIPLNSSYVFSVNYINKTSVNIFMESLEKKDANSMFSIWNYQSYTQAFTLYILGLNNDTLIFNLLNIGEGITSDLFAAVFQKSASDGFMLPFNMFNQKTQKFFVVSHSSQLKINNYNLEPFLSTYWTQIKQTIIFMPFLPFFSQCTFQKSYIILNDLLLPQNCIVDDEFGMQCKDRSFQIDCIIEQLLVSSVDNQFWFNHDESILFYLFPKQLTAQRINYYKSNTDVLTTLVETYYKNLIPVFYRRKSKDIVLVNKYELKFTLSYAETNQFEIVTAQIVGTYDENIPSPQSKVSVNVTYLQNWQNFNLYNQSFYWYIAYAMSVGCVLGLLIKLIQIKTGNIESGNKLKLIFSPVLKGFTYAILTGGSFIILMHIICQHTNFSSVSALFGSDMTGQLLLMNNKGRNGLILLFSGVYILNTSLQQAFKVSSSEQLKIVFEDDKQLNLNEEQLNEKIEFTKKNMFNHKRSILMGFFLMCFLGLIFFFNLIQFDSLTIAIIQLIVFPFIYKFTVEQQKILIFKELLYISGQYICMILAYAYYLLKNNNLYEFTYLYIVKFTISFFLDFAVELFVDYLMVKVSERHQTNCLAELTYKYLGNIIDNKIKESEYERSLYYAALIGNKMLGIMLFPFAIAIILLTQKNNLLPQALFITQQSIFFPLLMVVVLIPIQIYALFTVIEVLKRYFGIRIEEVIKFCHFKFKRSKFRWMNDEFAHSRDIHAVYREFQKFAFSSQLFFNTCLQALGLFVLGLGVITIILSEYLLFNDPVVLPMFMTVWITGDLLSVAVSFIAVKLRLYQKKEEETMRQSLYKIEKYLKLNDTNEYLQLQGVQDYFLNFNKEWIIFNFSKIFTKEDLQENNGELITKYKHYKSIFKKKQIQERRRIKKIKENSSSDLGSLFLSNDQPIKFNERKFNTLAKPIMYYWFYLSKQNIYLKGIVNRVKKEKIKAACEYCNMDVELQALEKKEFYNLVNAYRLLNVGRIFDEAAFLEYYRLNQQYITICLECKDKNLHLQTKINTKGISSKIVLSWLLTARSNLLHKKSG